MGAEQADCRINGLLLPGLRVWLFCWAIAKCQVTFKAISPYRQSPVSVWKTEEKTYWVLAPVLKRPWKRDHAGTSQGTKSKRQGQSHGHEEINFEMERSQVGMIKAEHNPTTSMEGAVLSSLRRV